MDKLSKKRSIAVITGATTGIGAAFAKKLSREGYNLIIHGRREEKLRMLANALEQRYNNSVKVIIAELSNNRGVRKIEEIIDSLPQIDLLINNAGYWFPGEFAERSAESLEQMVYVHSIVPARLIRAVLPTMLEHNSGGIINVASFNAYLAIPTAENYCATKAYLVALSKTLYATLLDTEVKIQAFLPGKTKTEFHSRINMKSEGMSPEKAVEFSLRALKKGQLICIPGKKNRFMVKILNLLPRKIFFRLMYKFGNRIREDSKKNA